MKQLRSRIKLVAVILLCCLLAVGGWVAVSMDQNGSRLVNSAYNRRLREARSTTKMGAVYDRSGVVLAESKTAGTRSYSSDRALRRAVSQTVGDQMMQSSTGVELFHASELLGLNGLRLKQIGRLLTGREKTGNDLHLTIDAGLSKTVSKLMQDYKGAVTVYNYKTGEILLMVSTPDYDPAEINEGGEAEADSAYLNRVLQGQYPPGSVFKIVVLLSALENIPGITKETFTCTGALEYDGGVMTCAGNAVHGDLTLKQAFSKSCNIAFASIARRLGPEKLLATAEKLGFNDDFLFDDIILYTSELPSDIAADSELVQTGIGQGRVLVTPLHMAMIAGAVANGGRMMEPALIRSSAGAPKLYRQIMSGDNALTIAKYMRDVVENGTGTRAKLRNYSDGYVCGKTGSAEASNDKTAKTHAWYVGFLYGDDEHPYSIAVVLEHAGSGGQAAATIASKTLRYVIDNDIK